MPVISNLVYTVTESTIVATWTTDVSSDSNLTAGGKNAIDNGVAPNSTSHQCVVAGLLPSTLYSCIVTSGGSSSSPQNVTTSASPTRTLVNNAYMGSVSTNANSQRGDTYRTLVASDNNTYITVDDGNGFTAGGGVLRNTQVGKLTNEASFIGVAASTLDNYGGANNLTGTDGPGGAAMGNKSTGLFAINGNLYDFVYRQFPPTYSSNRYCNWIKTTNFGSTWNNFTAVSTFTANGNPVTPNSPAEPIQFYDLTIGIVTPVLYGKDDGTLGYNSVGNQQDGGNAYVYCSFVKDNTPLYMLRIPRIQFDAQTTTAFEYWVGPSSPAVADFVNDTNWSASPTSATIILSTAQVGAWWQIAFVPVINSYIMTTWASIGGGSSRFIFYAAPTPAGPWKAFFTQDNTVSNSQWYGPFPMHRDILSNTLTTGIPVRIVYQGAPAGANYKPNWSTLTLLTGPLMANTFVQQAADTTLGPNTQSMTRAFSSNVTKGDLLIVAWRRGTSGVVDTVSDNMGVGNSWTIVYDASGTGAFGGWAYVFTQGSGACTVTVHQTVSQANGLLAVCEWNGPNTVRSAPTGNFNTSTQTPVSSSITPVAGDLIIGVDMSVPGGTAVSAIATVNNTRSTAANGATAFVCVSDLLSSAGGATVSQFSWTGAQTNNLVGVGSFFFTPVSITGNAGTASATVAWSGTASGSTTADGSGNYTIPNLQDGSYTVTPSKAGFTFSPANSAQTVVGFNVTGVNFTATAGGGTGTQGDMLTTNRWCTRLWG